MEKKNKNKIKKGETPYVTKELLYNSLESHNYYLNHIEQNTFWIKWELTYILVILFCIYFMAIRKKG